MDYSTFLESIPDNLIVTHLNELMGMAETLIPRMDKVVHRIGPVSITTLLDAEQEPFVNLSVTVVPGESFVRHASMDFALALMPTIAEPTGSPEWMKLVRKIIGKHGPSIAVADYMITHLDKEVAEAVAVATNSN